MTTGYVDYNTMEIPDLYNELDAINEEMNKFEELKNNIAHAEAIIKRGEFYDFTVLNKMKKELHKMEKNKTVVNALRDSQEIQSILDSKQATRPPQASSSSSSSASYSRAPSQPYSRVPSQAYTTTSVPFSTRFDQLSIDGLKSLKSEMQNTLKIYDDYMNRVRELEQIPDDIITEEEQQEHQEILNKIEQHAELLDIAEKRLPDVEALIKYQEKYKHSKPLDITQLKEMKNLLQLYPSFKNIVGTMALTSAFKTGQVDREILNEVSELMKSDTRPTPVNAETTIKLNRKPELEKYQDIIPPSYSYKVIF